MILFDLFRIYGKILVGATALVLVIAGGSCLIECVKPFVGDY